MAHGAALEVVAVEKRGSRRDAPADQSKFPGEIAGILHAGVHALAAGGTVDMRRIAGEKHSARAIVGNLPFVDAEGGSPERVLEDNPARPPGVDDRLELLQRRR